MLRARVRFVVFVGVAIGLTFGSARTSAHVIMGTKSLHLRIAESDLVVSARVDRPAATFVVPNGQGERSLVEITILETFKGTIESETLRLVQDGHDIARYRTGQTALFFLRDIARSRELRALAVAGGPTHVSSQEHDQQFLIEPPHGETLLAATQALALSESAKTREERITLIRKATLDLLTSGDPQLGAAGLASLVLTPGATLLMSTDLPRLEKFLADSTVSIGLRAGLLAELERRRLVEGPTHWLALLQNANPSQRSAAIRAAGQHPSEAVKRYLLDLLAKTATASENEIAAEAAMALGASRDVSVVDDLSKALIEGNSRLRYATIRGLGRIGGPEARRALEAAAATHSDVSTRRRASAELRSMTQQSLRSDRSGEPVVE